MTDRAPHINAPEQRHGGGVQRREQARAEARRVSGLCHATALAAASWWVCSWVGFPEFYGAMVAVLAALPWSALLIIARWRGIVHIDSTGVYRGVMKLYHVPSLLLFLSAMMDVHLFAWWQALPVTALAGSAVVLVTVKLDRRPAKRLHAAVVGAALVAFPYAYGVIAEGDTLLDRSLPQYFTPPVLDKHIVGGGRSPIRRYLTVGPWGPRAEAGDVAVDAATFHKVRRGETVCIAFSPGALGLPWYVATACG